jgi:opacity protein-like surface antigen
MGKLLAGVVAVASLLPAVCRAADVQYGGGALVGAPLGELADNVDVLGGLGGHAVFASRPEKVLGLRFDASIQLYGSRTLHVPLGDVSGRLTEDVTTDNWLASLSVGPQLLAPTGRLRPYLHPFAGVSYFATTTDVRLPRVSGSGRIPFATRLTSTNFDDTVFCYGAGAGVLIALGGGHVALDLGGRYVRNGRVSYLTESDLKDSPRGGVTLAPRRSQGNLLELRIGVAVVAKRGR